MASLLNLSSGRVMGGKKEDTYIQDGLVFWLDGIDKGSDDTAWIEKVNGYRFTGTAVREDNCYSFNSQYLNSPNYVGANRNDFTIEVCTEPTSSGNIIIASNVWSKYDVCVTFGGQLFNAISRICSPHISVNQKHTFSASNNRYIINGNLGNITGSYGTAWDNTNGTNLGARYNGSYNQYFIGKIYAIRVYSRQLSEEEIIHNQRVDNVRFNLGLNI